MRMGFIGFDFLFLVESSMVRKNLKSVIKKIEIEWLYVLAIILVASEQARAAENVPHLHHLIATDDEDISLFDVLLTQDTDQNQNWFVK